VLAWSAAGNLLGVWGVAFFAVPVLGTRQSLIAVGVLSLVLSLVWMFSKSSSQKPVGAAAMVLMLLPGAGLFAADLRGIRHEQPWKMLPQVLTDESAGYRKTLVTLEDSGYQQIAVWDEDNGAEKRRALSLNGSLQFLWNPASPLIGGGDRYEYYNYSTAAAA